MRTLLSSLVVLVACGDDGSSLPVDARSVDAAVGIDARLIDAPLDAPPDAYVPDAPPGAITAACTSACSAIATCAMEPDTGDCVGECSADLADCTPVQVQAVSDCTTEACGDLMDKGNSPLISCLTAISCIDM